MVRSYLIENRIRFDSDSGSGNGGLTDEDIDQNLQQDIAAAAFGGYGASGGTGNVGFEPGFDPDDRDTRAAINATRSIAEAARGGQEAVDRAQRTAANEPGLRAAVARLANPYPTNMSAIDQRVQNAARASLARPRTSTRTTGQDSRFFGDAYQDLFDQNPRGTTLNTVLQGGPLSALAANLLGLPSPREQAAMTAGQMFGVARQGLDREQEAKMMAGKNPMFDAGTGTFSNVPIGGTGGTMSTGFLGTPVYSGITDPDYTGPFQDQVTGRPGIDRDGGADQNMGQQANIFRGTTPSEGIATGGEIPSSELAVNFLENPFFAYSGFGNQFFPYGYATGTLVDLLQTRGMTQPNQADTLGLFGNPTDFS